MTRQEFLSYLQIAAARTSTPEQIATAVYGGGGGAPEFGNQGEQARPYSPEGPGLQRRPNSATSRPRTETSGAAPWKKNSACCSKCAGH